MKRRKRGTTRDMMVHSGRSGKQPVLVAQARRVQFSGPAPLTIFLGVPPPRCTTTPPCGHCWYCDVYAVQNP